jgi:magnesium-transporting ATPase (P-type)
VCLWVRVPASHSGAHCVCLCMHTGLVLFAGEETKVRLNATPAPTKSATMERATNRIVAAIFAFLVFLTVIFSSLALVRAASPSDADAHTDRQTTAGVHTGVHLGLCRPPSLTAAA